ncbi:MULTISPECIES: fumarylacetoacetate hydrolase family protein [Paraburkholderia]|uniref:Fumarylacetoacetate hydrolase family protein n=1 Tax=Paraburkholderia metrosideri TaxID=580937 RepID=A0ABW9E2H9_9BURK
MKLVSFSHNGRDSFGVCVGDRIVDIGRRYAGQFATLKDAIAGELFEVDFTVPAADAADPSIAEVRLLPPVPRPDKIICVGRNYRGHIAEAGLKLPDYPNLFVRLDNTLVAHGGALVRPQVSTSFDFEGELAVVIGKTARYVARDKALDYVFGYACFNDATLRDFQFDHSLTAGKNFEATGGFGPWIATSDEVGDPRELALTTLVNGTEMQHGHLKDLIFDIPYLISYVSQITTLSPGDILATGTPDGVGFVRNPPVWLSPGDEVEVRISRVGALANSVISSAGQAS